MLLQLPKGESKEKRLQVPEMFIPYPIEYYTDAPKIRVILPIFEEVQDLIRRYAIVRTESFETIERERYYEYRCMVHDEPTGVTRGILERLGYVLEDSEFSPFGLHWITLKDRTEKRRKR